MSITRSVTASVTAAHDEAAARVHGARFAYQQGPVVLEVASLELPLAGMVALVGANGSGKSTLLAGLAGLLPPVAGELEVFGRQPPPVRALAMVLQQHHADEALPLTVGEVVAMGRYAYRGLWRRLRGEDREAVDEALERLDIADLRHRQLAELSGGQRQRALVAQALAQRGRMLLLDEPVTGLDIPSRERIEAVLGDERADRPVVVATHDLEQARGADVAVLLAGRVVAAGPPAHALAPERLLEAYGASVGACTPTAGEPGRVTDAVGTGSD